LPEGSFYPFPRGEGFLGREKKKKALQKKPREGVVNARGGLGIALEGGGEKKGMKKGREGGP